MKVDRDPGKKRGGIRDDKKKNSGTGMIKASKRRFGLNRRTFFIHDHSLNVFITLLLNL